VRERARRDAVAAPLTIINVIHVKRSIVSSSSNWPAGQHRARPDV